MDLVKETYSLKWFAFHFFNNDEDVNDVMQNAAMKVFLNTESIKSRGIENYKKCIFQIIRHCCIDFYRKRKTRGITYTLDNIEDYQESQEYNIYNKMEIDRLKKKMKRQHKWRFYGHIFEFQESIKKLMEKYNFNNEREMELSSMAARNFLRDKNNYRPYITKKQKSAA